ncbi:MAG: YdeI/OmpD-associated family protein [Pseudomonadota bacterium]
MTKTENFERVEVQSAAELWAWLGENHARPESVWLVTWKKPSPRYLSTCDIFDAVIAHGWIDGIRRRHEVAEKTMQLIAPRKMQAWAQSYKDRAARLRQAGRMQPPGEAAIAAARKSGMWDFYADVDALIAPEDLKSALSELAALEDFEATAPSYRRNVLRWIKLAKTPATRAKRIAATARSARDGVRLPQM